jgi:quinol monooxygenase YgiN
MIRTTLFLTTTADLAEEVLAIYDREAILRSSIDLAGAVSAELSVSTTDPGSIMITALWPSPEAYEGWLANAERHRTSAILGEVLDGGVGAGGTWIVRTSLTEAGSVSAAGTDSR